MKKLGWEAGRNLRIEFRFAEGDAGRARKAVEELAALKPNLLVGHTNMVVAQLQKVTNAVPIVLVDTSDPVANAFVPNLARPGGNTTGFTNFADASIGGKWIELIHGLAPEMTGVGMLVSRNWALPCYRFYRAVRDAVEVATKSFGLTLTTYSVGDADSIERAIATIGGEPKTGLLVPIGAELAV